MRFESLLPGSALALSFELLRDRHAVLQKLCPGNDDVVAGFQTIEYHKVIADGIAEFQRLLPDHRPGALFDGDEGKELAVDALNGEHGNHRAFVSTPRNLGAYLLRDAKRPLRILGR